MKILLVVTNADLAGAPRHVLELCKLLSTKNNYIEVVFGEYGPVQQEILSYGIKTHIINTLRSNINPFQDILSIYKLWKIVCHYKPDLIHCHSTKAGFVARIVSSIQQIPVIYTVHGWGFGAGRKTIISIFVFLCEFNSA